MKIQFVFLTTLLLTSRILLAESITIPMYLTVAKGKGTAIGSVKVEDATCGVLLTPDLTHLTPGLHGFHVHVTPNCDEFGMKAGGHLDPAKTNEHLGPYHKEGHLGDMPVLIVDAKGNATLPILAPRFQVKKMRHHALMIHEGGDNYADTPAKLGGGGARIACGIIP